MPRPAGASATYLLKGLRCAHCASKIEGELAQRIGTATFTLNFVAQTFRCGSEHEETLRAVVRQIEPTIEVCRVTATGRSDADTETDRKTVLVALVKIILAASVLAGGSLGEDALHRSSFAWIEFPIFLFAFLLVGWPVLVGAFRNLRSGNALNEHFLMTIATSGAIALHQFPEAVGVMLFYSIGEFFQGSAVRKSRRSITALLAIRPDSARVMEGDGRRVVRPEEVAVGQLIEVKPGEKIPLDGIVAEGTSWIDTSTLTGESVPRLAAEGDPVFAGLIATSGRLAIRVARRFEESSVAKILRLVEEASGRKAPTERFITRFASRYTPAVVIAATLLAVVPPLVTSDPFSTWIYRALVLLVISCPCALMTSIPLSYFAGLGTASHAGILIKGGQYLDALTKLTTVAFDKTGTLTEGRFRVTRIEAHNGYANEDILRFAALAESHSSHPIAQSILAAWPHAVSVDDVKDYEEVKGCGVRARTKDGRGLVVGNDRLMHREQIEHERCQWPSTIVYVAVDGRLAGTIEVGDEPRANARAAIDDLRKLGVERIVMLTGDHADAANHIAAELGLDDSFSNLLPEDKVRQIEILKAASPGGTIAFIGDGINDAPVIARSDIGFAMGGLGSDAAIEAADVVLMDDNLGKLPQAVQIARRTRTIVIQNIVLALGVKAVFIPLGAFGEVGMWEAVIADVGVTVVAILNATRVLNHKV